MKVLLDSCVSGKIAAELRAHGHDVIWAGDWTRDPGDEEILRIAADEGRVLVTIDKDFGELLIVRGAVRVGLIRLVGLRALEQGPATVQLLATHADALQKRAIITAERWRIRVRHRDEDD